ncbi:MAG TPA: S9 family peptidase [Pyrinomonadaceae bacterium]|jgi:dipeptidyl aminopeptidase/acylaminoacyl peptidase|nr:S9 family peptidase [Pyrinomonadaceae bacterium]
MRSALARLFVVVLVFASAASAQKRNITEKDLFNFTWVADPQVAPDGSRVAFVRVTVNEKRDGYDTSVWVVATTAAGDAPHRLTSGNRDSSPRWSPDGKYLAFVRVNEKDGRPDQPQLFMLNLAGGDSFQVTSLPKGAAQPVWSPDGTQLAFLSNTSPEDLARQNGPRRGAQAANANANTSTNTNANTEHESDVRVITRAVYRSNGGGYLDAKHPAHLWAVRAPRSADERVTPRQLTRGRFEESDAVWSRDGARLYFATTHIDEPYYELPKTDIYDVPAAGGEPQLLTSFDMNAGGFSLSPDGQRLAFVASASKPVNSYTEPDLWVLELAKDAQPRNLTAAFDYDVGAGVGGDNTAPRALGGNAPVWTPDGRTVVELFAREGKANLGMFDAATGRETDLTSGNQAVVSFRAAPGTTKLVYTRSTPTQIGDLFQLDAAGAAPRQLTHLNEELFSRLNVTEPEEFWYTSFDGKRVEAWLQKPPDFDPHKKYPLILNIHGGPHTAYGYVFDHEFQWMAAKGYVVLYPNPRGSTSYGQEFGNVIQYRYPGDDYKDLMAGVDEVLKRGYVDASKLGVTGGSGGGLLTNWTVGHTTRFAAAVSQRDIASWADWWYSADFTLFQPTWFKAPPFEDPEDYRARSPITYVKDVKTPLMLILGEADYRTPPGAGGEEMFRALKFRKVPTVMVRFPGESHELSRSGQPWHRVERLEHIVGWFDHWLLGVPKPEYEVAPEREVPVKPEDAPGGPPQRP